LAYLITDNPQNLSIYNCQSKIITPKVLAVKTWDGMGWDGEFAEETEELCFTSVSDFKQQKQ
jgi:hypothetical protein